MKNIKAYIIKLLLVIAISVFFLSCASTKNQEILHPDSSNITSYKAAKKISEENNLKVLWDSKDSKNKINFVSGCDTEEAFIASNKYEDKCVVFIKLKTKKYNDSWKIIFSYISLDGEKTSTIEEDCLKNNDSHLKARLNNDSPQCILNNKGNSLCTNSIDEWTSHLINFRSNIESVIPRYFFIKFEEPINPMQYNNKRGF